MAKRKVSREPTTIGRFISWFAMVYFSVVTSTHETSDEVKAAAAAAAEVDVLINSIAVRVTTDASTPRQEVAPHNGNLHPVIRIVQEKELGKAVIPIAVAIAGTAIIVAGNDNLSQTGMTSILVLACLGIAAIWSGFLLSHWGLFWWSSPSTQWVPGVCIGIILMPFAIAVWQPSPT